MAAKHLLIVISLSFVLALAAGGQPVSSAVGRSAQLSPSAHPDRPDTGGPIGPWFPISLISNGAGHLGETTPSAAYNSTWDEYLVVWQQGDSLGNSYLYGQFVKRDGGLIGGRFVISGCSNNSGSPDVVYNPYTKEYLIVSEYIGAEKGICSTRLDMDGTLIESPKAVVYSSTDYLRNPAAAYEVDTDQYLVAWEDFHDSSTSGIGAVSFTGDFTKFSSVIDITGMPDDITPTRPDVACVRPNEMCLVVWHWWFSTAHSDHEVYGQLIHMENGAHKQGGWIGIAISVDDEAEAAVSSVARNTGIGQFLVVYEENAAGYWLTGGQTITDGGALDQWISSFGLSNGSAPAVAGSEATQEYLVAWPSADGTWLRTRTVSTTGEMYPILQALSVMTAPLYPAIASGNLGDYLVTAQDHYPGYPNDIFGYLWGVRLYAPLVFRN